MDELVETFDAKLISNPLTSKLDNFLGLLVNGLDSVELLRLLVFLYNPVIGVEEEKMHNEAIVKTWIREMLFDGVQAFFVRPYVVYKGDELTLLIQDIERNMLNVVDSANI